MIISWNDQDALECSVGEYDAIPPVDALRLGTRPASLNADREAVAAFLAFGAWTSGDLELPRPLSPATAEAIERTAHPVRIRPRAVQYVPSALPRGHHPVHVLTQPTDSALPIRTITVLPNVGTHGAMRSRMSYVVSSNAFALDTMYRSEENFYRARLAVAVLFAEDMDADSLHLHAASPLRHAEVVKLRELLSRVNLGFEAETPVA